MASKVLVWMSGGVDSAVSAYLLMQQWYEVIAWFMKNYADETNPNCQTKQDRDMAIKVSQHLGITTFVIFDFRKQYHEKIVQYIYDGYKSGITPNPDILCNSEIKFKLFLEEAKKLWCDYIATGHYARITHDESWYHLLKGVDANKDQSYFLAWLNQDQLAHSLFPIGHLTKPEVREIATQAWLPNADRKDSQGLCFIGKVRIKDFLNKELPKIPGKIVDTSWHILGTHDGVYFYTIWQREGIGIPGWWTPYYVLQKDLEHNLLIVGTEDQAELFGNDLITTNRHRIGKTYDLPLQAHAKIRYRQEDQTVILAHNANTPTNDTKNKKSISSKAEHIHIHFETPQRAISSGQTVAVYQWDELIGSGIIA